MPEANPEPKSEVEEPSPEERQARDLQQSLAVQHKLRERLVEKGNTGPCSVCGTNNWVIGSYVAMGTTAAPGQISLGGPSYPFVVLFCSNCGNSQFINLLTLGFTQADWPDLTLPPPPKPSG